MKWITLVTLLFITCLSCRTERSMEETLGEPSAAPGETQGSLSSHRISEQVCNVAHQLGDSGSLLDHYRRLIQLRRTYTALRTSGNLRLLEAPQSQLWAMLRYDTQNRLLVVVNVSGETILPEPLDLSAHADVISMTAGQLACDLGSCEPITWSTGLASVPMGGVLQPGEARVLLMAR